MSNTLVQLTQKHEPREHPSPAAREFMAPSDTKQRIICAAATLIHRQGFGATTIEDVLEESGVKKGNLYYYFSSKQEMGLAVLDFLHESHMQTVRSFLENQALSPRERMSQWLMSLLGRVADNQCACGCPFGNLALELSDKCEVFRSRIAQHFDEWQGVIATAIREGQDLGEFNPNLTPHEFAASAVATMEGAILMAKLRREIAPVERAIADLRAQLEVPARREAA